MKKPGALGNFSTTFEAKIPFGSLWLLQREIHYSDNLLDLGCGPSSPIRFIKHSYSVGVDIYEPYLRSSIRAGIHDAYVKADLRQIDKAKFPPASFDVVLAYDVIEHLTKDEGHTLVDKCKYWAKKKVMISTPNSYWPGSIRNVEFQRHKSGWSVTELRNLGFDVYGTGTLYETWENAMGYYIHFLPAKSFCLAKA